MSRGGKVGGFIGVVVPLPPPLLLTASPRVPSAVRRRNPARRRLGSGGARLWCAQGGCRGFCQHVGCSHWMAVQLGRALGGDAVKPVWDAGALPLVPAWLWEAQRHVRSLTGSFNYASHALALAAYTRPATFVCERTCLASPARLRRPTSHPRALLVPCRAQVPLLRHPPWHAGAASAGANPRDVAAGPCVCLHSKPCFLPPACEASGGS